jgi:hypothetical protein
MINDGGLLEIGGALCRQNKKMTRINAPSLLSSELALHRRRASSGLSFLTTAQSLAVFDSNCYAIICSEALIVAQIKQT